MFSRCSNQAHSKLNLWQEFITIKKKLYIATGMQKTSIQLSIVLPCYNPLENWMEIIENNFNKLKDTFTSLELIIVNDGSTANFDLATTTIFFSSHPEIKIVSYSTNRGKGYALRQGVKVAAGNLIIYTDIDFPYTAESLMDIYNTLLNQTSDLAIGIRGAEYYRHLPKARVHISKALRWSIKLFLHIPTDDTQCGLKGFNQTGKKIFLQTDIDRYLFDLEFVFLAARENIRIKTVEVELRPEIILSKMNWKILFQESVNFLKIFARGC